MNRTQTILAVILAFQIALIAGVEAIRSSRSAEDASHPLVPALARLDPSKIVVEGKSSASVTLERNGKTWRVTSANDWPADISKVHEVLGKLKRLKVRDPIATGKNVFDTLEVGDKKFLAHVELFASASDTKPKAEIYIGTAPSGGMANVRAAGQKAVYEANGISPYDFQAENNTWIDKNLVDVHPEDVVGLSIQNGSGSFDLQKSGGTWTVASSPGTTTAKLDPKKVDNLVHDAASIMIAEPAGSIDATAQGFDSPAATVTLRVTPAGAKAGTPPITTVVRIGKIVKGNSSERYITREGFPFAAKIWNGSVEKLVNAKLDALTGS